MKVVALYDIHAVPWALEAVLAEVEADAIVIGGDFTYGPYPREVLEQVRALDATVIRGNCERDPADWDRSQLDDEQIEWMQSLPLSAELDGVLYCHAAPDDDMPITTADTDDAIVAETFAGTTGTVMIGHTHHQFDRQIGDLRIVNAGSVGMPYEGEVAAFWTLVVDGEPEFRKTPFDIDRAVRELRASGWPQVEEFIEENVLQAVSREEAIAAQEARR